MDIEKLREMAHALIEAGGGLELILASGYPRYGKDEPSLFSVACCPICLGPEWISSSKAEQDSWKIDEFSYHDPFRTCGGCTNLLGEMAPAAAQLAERTGMGHARVVGTLLLRQTG
jgi:hypothetical protein